MIYELPTVKLAVGGICVVFFSSIVRNCQKNNLQKLEQSSLCLNVRINYSSTRMLSR